ncbi:hypothetical protein PEC106568_19060 [Pectobacterium carotovorum subsp. carotovorum]|nr:hypothetical protein PEC106568_19060 [Pectobacterium carotovorum subsp. carotovorum]
MGMIYYAIAFAAGLGITLQTTLNSQLARGLGGSSLNTLFCTSARVGLTEPTTYDGALFSIRSPFFAGLPESRFGLISSRRCRRKRMRH